MEDTKKPDQSTADDNDTDSPSSGQVMDIQSPKPSDTAPTLPTSPESTDDGGEQVTVSTPAAGENPPEDSVSEPAAESGLGATTAAAVTEEPASVASASAPEAAVQEPKPEDTTPTDQPADPAPNPLAIPPEAAHKSGAPVVAIVVAILVALGLAALVVFTFMKSKNNSTSSTNTSATQTATKPLASPADVDTTDKELDASLNKLDDSKDFATTDLSDKSLGL